MSFEQPIVQAGRRADRRWVQGAVLLALALMSLRLIEFLVDATAAVRFPWELDYGEGIVWEQMRLMMAGRGYGTIDGLPAIVFHYPPLYHSLTAAVAAVGAIDPLAAGRSLSLASTLLIALLGGLIAAKVVRADSSARVASLCGLVAALAFFCFSPVGFWGPLMRVDMLSIALSFAGVLAAMAALQRPGSMVLSAALFVAAVYTKQISIVAPAAVFLTFLLLRPRLALVLAVTCMALGLAVLGALEFATDGRFMHHIFLYNVNRFDPSRLTSILGETLTHLFFAAAVTTGVFHELAARLPHYRNAGGIAGLRARLIARPADAYFLLLITYAGLAGLVALGIAKSGSNVNYFIEGMAVLAVLLGVVARDAANVVLGVEPTSRRGIFSKPAYIPAMIAVQAMIGPPRNDHLDYRAPKRVAELTALKAMIQSASRPVVSDDMVLLRRSGVTVQWEPAIFAELAKTGDWNEKPFVSLIRKGHFAFFVTAGGRGQRLFDSRYNAAVADAMDAAYPVRRKLAGYTIHLPSTPGAGSRTLSRAGAGASRVAMERVKGIEPSS